MQSFKHAGRTEEKDTARLDEIDDEIRDIYCRNLRRYFEKRIAGITL
jgi:hypothetical protein